MPPSLISSTVLAMARAVPPAIPPLPTEGGSYVLRDGRWECVQRTLAPGDAPPPQPQPEAPAPTPED